MEQQRPIEYSHQLMSLIHLIKSNSPQGERVIGVLKTGDEKMIRNMLMNFGNPKDPDWWDFTTASPWATWQIDQAMKDALSVKPEETTGLTFWAW